LNTNKKPVLVRDEKIEYVKSVQLNFYKIPPAIKEDLKFNLIEPVNDNIKFGGFYNGSINIQFSPSMYIKPFSFLSIYANRQENLFIPKENLKDYSASLAVETAGIVLIENFVNLFSPPDNTVRSISKFVLKNCINLLAAKIFNGSSDNNSVYKYNFYFVSAGVIF